MTTSFQKEVGRTIVVSNDNRRHQKERGTNLKGCGESARKWQGDFPGGTVGKNLPANTGNMGLIPGLGRFHMP